jgi:hypothetical protein
MFRFTIRELFLLTIIVALGVGWFVEHYQHLTWKWRADVLANQSKNEGWTIEYRPKDNPPGMRMTVPGGDTGNNP